MKRFFLYRHFSSDDELLYVGVTFSLISRSQQHTVSSDWFDLVTKITIERFQSRRDALDAENKAILLENPKFNRTRYAGNSNARAPVTERYIDIGTCKLLDIVKDRFSLKTDSALASILEIGAPEISKLRTGVKRLPDGALIKIHELLGIEVMEIRAILKNGVES